MKLQTKFFLGILAIFVLLAAVIAVVSVKYVSDNTIREAEDRVEIYARAAWEIYDGTPQQLRALAQVLARGQLVRDLLRDAEDEELTEAVREDLEAIRQEHKMDILNVLGPDGTVLLRTRFPYNSGDDVASDPLVHQVISKQQSVMGSTVFELDRLDVEGSGLVERVLAIAQEPRGMLAGTAVPVMEDGQLIGIIQMGNLLNGSVDVVDRIRDAVFANEHYQEKPLGTATIFMDDLRISTNVLDNQGRRALGTRVSREVAEHVLEKGLSWTGRAFVVDTWYLAQYDPIRDPNGEIIGVLYVGELEQKYLDLRTREVTLYLVVILGGMLLALVVVFLLTRGILGPIRTLSEATERISHGDLSYRVEVRSKDELGDLSACFNDMAAQLQEQRREIEANQKELEALNRELLATNRNYMEMLGFVSHELKNPLTSAIMSLHTVKDGYLGEINPEQRKSLESTAQSLDYFQDMIKDYLDLSRLEKGELEVSKAQIVLGPGVVVPVLNGLSQELQEQQMVVDNRIPEDLALNADGNLLRIVYDNLLSNAVKYGRTGGRILLAAQEGRTSVSLSVTNEGDGIPPEKMSKLFGKFSRLDTPSHAAHRGTGLGLFICKEIIEAQGGEIWADCQIGEWVKFSFTLPK
jgi:signal transduction histidine kinase